MSLNGNRNDENGNHKKTGISFLVCPKCVTKMRLYSLGGKMFYEGDQKNVASLNS